MFMGVLLRGKTRGHQQHLRTSQVLRRWRESQIFVNDIFQKSQRTFETKTLGSTYRTHSVGPKAVASTILAPYGSKAQILQH